MSEREAVPADVWAAARRVYVGGGNGSPDHAADLAVVGQWAARRYGGRAPLSRYDAAFWCLSVAFGYGIKEPTA